MDTEKQKSSPGGTVPGEKVPPVLTAEDVAALEELCGDVSGYFYKMLDYLDQRVRDGVRQGEFTEEQARGDLDLALWYAYACNNIDDYDYYYKAAQWMPASEPAAEAAGSGIWYYRYACALMYCGRLEEARHYAETGVSLDPEYPWGWLETGKLRAHFGDRDGALEAVRRGLELVPGDYEFTTLRREIQEGRTLEEMEFHWIDPECDAVLQAGGDENEAEKRLSIAGICCDPENLAAIKAALSPWSGRRTPLLHLPDPLSGRQPHRPVLSERGGAVQVSPLLGPGAGAPAAGAGPPGPNLPGRPGGAGNGGTIPGMVRGPSGPDDAPVLHPGAGPADGPVRQGFLPLQRGTGSPP